MRFVSILLLVACTALSQTAFSKSDPLDTLRPGHPRLIWTDVDFSAPSDALQAALRSDIRKRAEALLDAPLLKRELEGIRLLAISREALGRVSALAAAWRLSGEKRYLVRAEAELLNLSEFDDWNPSHFLDTAEMTAALAIGYDWLHGELSESSRARIREAIVEKGLKPSLETDTSEIFNYWSNNWNLVCNGGMVMGALAVAEHEPELAEVILQRAIRGLPKALAKYAPDGVFPEGPAYWNYGTIYFVLLLDSLDTALDTTFGFRNAPGFAESSAFIRQSSGPTNQFHNFSDGGNNSVKVWPALYWMAAEYEQRGLVDWQDRFLQARLAEGEPGSFDAFLMVWRARSDSTEKDAPPAPLSWFGRGENPVAYLRSRWAPEGLFVGIKGGRADRSHGHMDSGSFVMDRDGLRWVIDPPTRRYHYFESFGVHLWGRKQDSERWKVFEMNPFSHATLTINGALHRVDEKAAITQFSAGDQSVVVDLSGTLGAEVQKATRRFEILPNERLRVTDTLEGLAPGSRVRWSIPTHANIRLVRDNGSAILEQSGKELRVRIQSKPLGALSVDSLNKDDPPWRVPVDGVRQLVVEVTADEDGSVWIQALFGKRID